MKINAFAGYMPNLVCHEDTVKGVHNSTSDFIILCESRKHMKTYICEWWTSMIRGRTDSVNEEYAGRTQIEEILETVFSEKISGRQAST